MNSSFEGVRLENIITRGYPFSDPPQENRLMGYIRAYFDGYRWWNTAFQVHRKLETPERIAELDALYALFRRQVKSLQALGAFCRRYAGPDDDPDEFNGYVRTEHGVYWFRFILRKGDYNLYLKAFEPAVPEAHPENFIPQVE